MKATLRPKWLGLVSAGIAFIYWSLYEPIITGVAAEPLRVVLLSLFIGGLAFATGRAMHEGRVPLEGDHGLSLGLVSGALLVGWLFLARPIRTNWDVILVLGILVAPVYLIIYGLKTRAKG